MGDGVHMLVLSNARAIILNRTKPTFSARECVIAARPYITELVNEFGCTAHGLRVACNGMDDPHVFGCADVTAAGCATCFNHKEAFENVCVWCKSDSQCHDVGSLEDPCSNDQCISIAVKTQCTDHNVSDCPARH